MSVATPDTNNTAETFDKIASIPLTKAVGSGDRLSFTLFVAIAVHALLILGVTFSYNTEPNIPPTFEVTLATHQSLEAPDEADYQAQFNQEASGTTDAAKELTTNRLADFSDTRIRDVLPQPETQAKRASEAQDLNRIDTTSESRLTVAKLVDPEELEAQIDEQGQEMDAPLISPEIASLKAKLALQQQAYAKKPRIKRLTSVATTASVDAAYLNMWREKVELIGNENFPQEALQQKIFGDLRLLTVLKPNGTIDSVEIMQSSGYKILDSAALQIVHLAAPFAPFPPEIAKEADRLEIIRTWRFEITGLSTK